MLEIPKILIVSTDADISLSMFRQSDVSTLINPDFINYDIAVTSETCILESNYNYVYFRDPFNDGDISHKLVKQATEIIVDKFKSAYFVDSVLSFNGLLFEDKWLQYRQLSKYMPKSELLQSIDLSKSEKYFIKKRISSRSKGIIFKQSDFPNNTNPHDYILQQKLSIDIEYRVFIIGGRIIKPMAIKTSKTFGQKVKITGIENTVTKEIIQICDAVYVRTEYDFMGLDIAKVGNDYYLLEVNRSPQFKGYFRETSINLAYILNEYLLTKD
jgi:glutathione synthase/RimK-type ligase-like ATP-grasp enzyme